ncbi:DNA alkylation repair protein [Psychromarinibacter sp. C21-152]|uniref:DNA alkylation repair protein n=1 Tax=Psychromarinibacter sediminicola TaxID=3033385 RepID=A0AAE3NS44_9RHOB|nr:DNA alkylation repair protein [Psychromarinibacter sediminicola]MDF0600614.1 DNA alkylation repair protein [Psychromarinibacter sediminicola]
MTPDAALAALEAAADPDRAEGMAAYHKVPRRYLGVAMPEVNALTADWRKALPVPERVALADALWATDIHEARIAAAKLLTQARMRPAAADDAAWRLIASWVPQFDAWAIADHAASAGGRRLVAEPSRLDEVERWTASDHMWTRRAALVMTLPWTKQTHPTPQDEAIRDRVLGWAAGYVPDRAWFIQKAIAWWLRELSKHDPDRTRAFLDAHGADMKPFARKDAAKYL